MTSVSEPVARRPLVWRRSIPPLVVDVGLAAVVAVIAIVAIRVASSPRSRPPDPHAYTLGLVTAAVLLVRR